MNPGSNNNTQLSIVQPHLIETPKKVSFFKRIPSYYFIYLSFLLLLISIYFFVKNVLLYNERDTKENQIKNKKNIRNSRFYIFVSVLLLIVSNYFNLYSSY
jgi:Na+/H+ antiporter NhaC